MSFTWPWALVLLAPATAVIGARWMRWGRRSEVAWYTLAVPRRLLAVHALGLLVLVVAVARPNASVALPRVEGTLVLAFDNSSSMLATDAEPTRLGAAQRIAHRLVDDQPSTVRIGVVSFSSGGVVLQQATTRHGQVHETIDRLAPEGDTSLAQGLFTALGAVVGEPIELTDEAIETRDPTVLDIGFHAGAVVVVLTDGEDRGGGDPRQMARLAANSGIRIFTIGVGDADGTTLQLDGFTVATALDEPLLEQVADLAGGNYFAAVEGVDLDAIGDAIGRRLTVRGERAEITGLVTVAGMAVVLLGAALSMRWIGRVVP